jgi:hypothetical protein
VKERLIDVSFIYPLPFPHDVSLIYKLCGENNFVLPTPK